MDLQKTNANFVSKWSSQLQITFSRMGETSAAENGCIAWGITLKSCDPLCDGLRELVGLWKSTAQIQ